MVFSLDGQKGPLPIPYVRKPKAYSPLLEVFVFTATCRAEPANHQATPIKLLMGLIESPGIEFASRQKYS